jgi:hypothetical protein
VTSTSKDAAVRYCGCRHCRHVTSASKQFSRRRANRLVRQMSKNMLRRGDDNSVRVGGGYS